jgi:hypothetical protein
VDSRAAADEGGRTSRSGMSSSPLSPYTCNNKNTQQQQSVLIFDLFTDLLFFLFFSVADPLPSADRSAVCFFFSFASGGRQ